MTQNVVKQNVVKQNVVKQNDTPVWSAEAGDASHPLIVLVHGAMDRAASMLKLSRRLDDKNRVLRYDRRGYGHSAAHPGPFTMGDQVADLVALLAGRRAVLIGHSYGGNVAMATAARHGDLVAGVVMYESPLAWESFWPASSMSASAAHAPVPTKEEAANAAEGFMRRLIGAERWLALPERTRLSRRTEGLALVSELKDLREHQPWSADDVNVPVIVGVGGRASERYLKGMAHVTNSVAGATLVCLEGCTHDAPTAAPDQFRRELIEPLLQRVGKPWGCR